MKRLILVLAGCAAAPAARPTLQAPPPSPPPDTSEHYMFRRVYPGSQSRAFRQTFELAIEHGNARLHIVTAEDAAPRTNVDIDRATFEASQKVNDGEGTATTDPATGELVLDLAGGTHWRCARIVTHVATTGAHLPVTDHCVEDSVFELAAMTEVRVLSCRADGDPLTGSERLINSHRWTFAPAPGIELLGDACGSGGILRRPQ